MRSADPARKSRFGARSPVPRSSTRVSHRENPQLLGCDQVGDAVWEADYWYLAHLEVRGHTGNQRSSIRPGGEVLDGPVDGREERLPQTGALSRVPQRCCFELVSRFRLEGDRPTHPSVSARRTRSRTSVHASPCDSPANTLRARPSSSSAHACSTAASSPSGGPSRLTKSSAARSARSASGSERASRSSDWVCSVMRRSYPPPATGRPRIPQPSSPAPLLVSGRRHDHRNGAMCASAVGPLRPSSR